MFTGQKACDSCGHSELCAIKMDYEQYLSAIENAEKYALNAMGELYGLDRSIRDKYFTTNAHCGLWVAEHAQKPTRKTLYPDKNSQEIANLAENYGE